MGGLDHRGWLTTGFTTLCLICVKGWGSSRGNVEHDQPANGLSAHKSQPWFSEQFSLASNYRLCTHFKCRIRDVHISWPYKIVATQSDMMIHHDPSVSVHVEHTLNDHQIANHAGFITAWHSRCHGCHDTRHTSGPSRSSRWARDGERSAHWSSKIPGTASAGARSPQIQMLHLGDCGTACPYCLWQIVTSPEVCDLQTTSLEMWTYLGEAKRSNLAARLSLNSMFMCHAQLPHKDPTSIVRKEKSSMIYPERIISNGVTLRTPVVSGQSCLRSSSYTPRFTFQWMPAPRQSNSISSAHMAGTNGPERRRAEGRGVTNGP